MQYLNQNLSTETIKKRIPKLNFVFFNEGVYDMTGYIQHPGGNKIIGNLVGKEISRYFLGSYKLETF